MPPTNAVFNVNAKRSNPFCGRRVSASSVVGPITRSILLLWCNRLPCILDVWLLLAVLPLPMGGLSWPFTMWSATIVFGSWSGSCPRKTLVAKESSANMTLRGPFDTQVLVKTVRADVLFTSFGVPLLEPPSLANISNAPSCVPGGLILPLSIWSDVFLRTDSAQHNFI